MSYGNAVRQREEMITAYHAILKTETNPERIADIKQQISICEDEITTLKKGKPLFGRPKPIVKESRLIENNPEKPGEQKVTVINPAPKPVVVEPVEETEPAPTPTRLTNNLRNAFKAKKATAAENSLKAQIEAAKAAKSKV